MLYWSTETGTRFTSVCGDGEGELFPDQQHAGLLAVDSQNIYMMVVDASNTMPTIESVSKTSGMETVLAGPGVYMAMTVDTNQNVFWVDQYSDLMKLPQGGSATRLVASNTAPGYFPTGPIAADSANVYWNNNSTYSNFKGLYSCPVTGCATPTQLSSVPQGNLLIAIDQQNVYTASGGTVYACAKSGCGANPTVLGYGITGINSLATDGVNVYWTDSSNGTGEILKCSVTGCASPTVFVSAPQDYQLNVAVDQTSVYWTTSSGKVMRANK